MTVIQQMHKKSIEALGQAVFTGTKSKEGEYSQCAGTKLISLKMKS